MKIIKVQGLTKKFGEFTAVDNISFSVEKGQLIGFLGVNGAGKSTTINMMSTLLTPTSGEIEICGSDVRKDGAAVRKKIGMVSQGNVLDDCLSVKENLICRGTIHGTAGRRAAERLAELSRIFSLDGLLSRRYRTLSGGQKRKCEIAAALMHTPEILILDEPTTGLDPASRKEVWSTVTGLRKDTGMTVFLTTHYMEEAAESEDVMILNRGRIAARGTPHQLKERYAADRLRIYCTGKKREETERLLEGTDMSRESFGVVIRLRSTKDALPILEKVGRKCDGFEVIEGTLDDVFLDVTGEDGQ